MKVSSRDEDIKSILDSGYYHIPRFQRPYSWEKENVSEFLEDILNSKDEEYFIGSMVVYKKEQSHFGVVDGQQRLTTITMVLCSIRDLFKNEGLISLAEGIQFMIERKDLTSNNQYIIQSETSYPYLQECIQQLNKDDKVPTPKDEEKCLKNAFELLKTSLQKETEKYNSKDEKKDYLESIRDKILKVKAIFIELDNEDDAYVIFETLNTRGKDLGIADLVKNHFTRLMRKRNRNVDRTRDKWREILDHIQTSKVDIDINLFIFHYWLSKESYTTKKKLFKEFKNKINEKNAKTYLEELEKESSYYRVVYEPSFLQWKKEEDSIRNSLEALSLFKVKQHLPFVLAIISEYKKNKLKTDKVKKFLEIVENFHFVHNAVTSQRSTTWHSRFYSGQARELRNAPDHNERDMILTNVKNKLSLSKPLFDEFKISFSDLKYSNRYTKDKKLIQYILKKFYKSNNSNSSIPIDYRLMTIEHLCPQSDRSMSEEEVANIGNLLFISSQDNNEELEDKPFKDKIEILKNKYGDHLGDTLLKSNEWDQEKIRERAKKLALQAYERIWSF